MKLEKNKKVVAEKESLLMVIDILNELQIRYWIEGGWFNLDVKLFTESIFEGRIILCISVEEQKLFHSGYELREVDKKDMETLNNYFFNKFEN